MACARCGSTTATDTGTCTVCDPWAAPKPGQAARPAARTRPRTTAGKGSKGSKGAKQGDLPVWLKTLIRISPPAEADLEQAWRGTIRLTQARLAYYVLVAATCIGTVAGLKYLYPVFIVLLLGFGFVARRMQRSSWLYQAVAVVGTRPDIGYRRFARIPALVRVTDLNKVFGVVIAVLLIGRIVTLHTVMPLAVSIGLWALIWVLAATTTCYTYALHDRARKDLDRMLAVRAEPQVNAH